MDERTIGILIGLASGFAMCFLVLLLHHQCRPAANDGPTQVGPSEQGSTSAPEPPWA